MIIHWREFSKKKKIRKKIVKFGLKTGLRYFT